MSIEKAVIWKYVEKRKKAQENKASREKKDLNTDTYADMSTVIYECIF